jgi:transcriptional regulator with GAF, ATPase, and Fis domain/TolA-binding protein
MRGSYDDADRFLEAAGALYEGPADDESASPVQYRRATILYLRGRYEDALKAGFTAYRILKHSNRHAQVAEIQHLLAYCYYRLGMLPEAEEFFTDALSTYRRVEHRAGIAHVFNDLGLLHKIACRWNRALASLNKSREIAKTLGMTRHLIRVDLNLGVVCAKLRRFPEAFSALSGAATAAERMGDQVRLTKSLLMLGRTHVQTGDLARAERYLMRAQAIATDAGYPREIALADEYIGELMMARRKYPEARANLLAGLKGARRIAPEGDIVAECLRRLAEVEYSLGNTDTSLEYIDEGVRIAEKCEAYELGYFYRTHARCLSRKGEVAEASAMIEKSIATFDENGNEYEKACSRQVLARLRLRSGDEAGLARARQALSESVADFGRLEEPNCQVVSHIMLASVEQRLGNIDDALLAVYEADRIVEEEQNARFRPALKALREKIESRLTRATTRVLDQFSVLGDVQNGARSREQLGEGLESTLRLILERLGADAGFVAIPSESGKTLHVVARDGLTARESQAAATWYARSSVDADARDSIVVTDLEHKPELEELRSRLGNATGTLLMQGLGFDDERLGVLCVHQSGDSKRGPVSRDALSFVAAYASLISLSIYELLRNERRDRQKPRSQTAKGFERIVTDNTEMIELLNLSERVAHSDATVLLQGETGTGKGLIAYAIHLLSDRRDRPFVHVNCAALPEQLLESELFGHVRGAFTGAHADKEGLLLQANGGTVFLDEIGKTSLAMQGKLLQFLDNSKVRRVGSNDYVSVEVRVICASKANLLGMVDEGRFLEDFFYRINDFPLVVPPLRKRREDIPLLMHHYLDKLSREMNKVIEGVSDEFVEKLIAYQWPGNVRELEKIVKRAIILADDGDVLGVEHLGREVVEASEVPPAPVEADLTLRERIAQLEHEEILTALRRHAGNKSRAAIHLGISYPNLLSKIKRYNIQ